MLSARPLDNLLGADLIGLVISTIIYGITCLQTYAYYTKCSENDRWPMKFIVALMWVLDSSQVALVTIAVYHYTVVNWGDAIVLGRTTWSLEFSIPCGKVMACIVQCFFARRIWFISGKNWSPACAIVALSLFQLAFGTALMVHRYQTQFVATTGSKTTKFMTATALSGDIACDITIAMSVCYYLQKSRTAFKSTNTMINLLITYAIRTCLLTTVCFIACLVTYLMYPETRIYCVFFFIGCRLYSNSLLSALNAREDVMDKGKMQGGGVISLPSLSRNGTHNTNDGHGTLPIGSHDQWLHTEAHDQHHRSPAVNECMDKLSV